MDEHQDALQPSARWDRPPDASWMAERGPRPAGRPPEQLPLVALLRAAWEAGFAAGRQSRNQ